MLMISNRECVLANRFNNKNGVLLYDRDTKLTMQAIYGIRNFGLMGLYILEPAEPLPPMSEEDINFERFQTMAVFSIKEDLQLIIADKKDKGLDWLCSLVIKNYANLPKKIILYRICEAMMILLINTVSMLRFFVR